MDQIKSIRSTYLYETFNKGGAFDDIMKTFVDKGIEATPEMLNSEYSTINNYFKFPLKISIMNAIKDGTLVPMLYPKGITANYKVPTSVPFILTPFHGSIKAIAIIDNYAKFDNMNGDRIIIDPNKLYCLLESAYIARGIQMHFTSVRNNTHMYSEGSVIFAHMFTRVLNREYALNVDKDAYNKVVFLSAKYFMLNILQMKDSDMVFNYALKAAGNLSPIMAKRLSNVFTEKEFVNIATFVQAIANNGYLIINGIHKLTVRSFVDQFIRMYSNAALFSLEHLSYFIFNIISCTNHAYLNNQYAFDTAVGTKSTEKLYSYIANTVK